MLDFAPDSRSLALTQTVVKSTFWLSRMRASKEGALPAIWERMKETGRWDVLRLQWKEGMPNRPHQFWDSDVAKWTEAACYALTPYLHPTASAGISENLEVDDFLASKVAEAVSLISGAQWEDGYINSYFTVVEPGKRWSNIAWNHEHYCAGHLLEAALAHNVYATSTQVERSADPDALLNPILKYVAHIEERFGPDVSSGQKRGYPGHQELELALLKLYDHLKQSSPPFQNDTTTTTRLQNRGHAFEHILSLASFFIQERGRLYNVVTPQIMVMVILPRIVLFLGKHYFDYEATLRNNEPSAKPGPAYPSAPRWTYNQANAPLSEISSVEGHSVRAGYWLTAVAHLARVTRDVNLLNDVNKLWDSMTERKMHVTGGLGAIGEWEGFGPDYYFPNESAYLETCASVSLVFFAHQMLLINPMDVRFGDTLERALYNGALVGMSFDGNKFFYDNPLATVGMWRERTSWFEVSCCPPNLARLLNSLGKYIYTQSTLDDQDTIHVHLLIDSEATLTTSDGQEVRIIQESSAPWSGHVAIRTEGLGAHKQNIAVRIPDWADLDCIEIATIGYATERPQQRMLLFIPFSATEKTKINIEMGVKPRLIYPHPLDTQNYSSVAVARGPFIYCLETVDNHTVEDLRRIRIPRNIQFEEFEMKISSGSPVVGVKASVRVIDSQDDWEIKLRDVHDGDRHWVMLNSDGSSTVSSRSEKLDVVFIPFFSWANRGRSDVRVWLPMCNLGE